MVLWTAGESLTVGVPDMHRLLSVAVLLDVQAVQGDGSRPDVLDKAEAHAADLVLEGREVILLTEVPIDERRLVREGHLGARA